MKGKSPRPIIIVRKVVAGHDEEHGGAWKVAYADFVTAMMALQGNLSMSLTCWTAIAAK